ncbi:dolichyl-phosphate beta-glucosyltransferase [Bdellovibrio bacteriovorus]|uniref:dolichyl-phosphate beta-glucosyltransferase n=1 Tax=Bdellovibrio bacteriovorus str. Tiberius TaxID=1069642 RepID=K7YW65_BDEBC|nr:glycosyltransferase [Bdellovibrio bacteriovorus]AFY01908.1 dolichyl-phosphate beta-glucosyltransferase [Bdellovibrio bacteriovorus str. Tiberius]
MQKVSVVIPAYNEEERLPGTLQRLRELSSSGVLKAEICEVLVIDDGSRDRTREVVEKDRVHWPVLRLHSLQENQGKGAAVKKGLIESRGDWILVADADMATPWEELNKLLTWSESFDLIMGSRALPDSQIEVRQHWIRQTMGKIFNRIMRFFIGLPYKDTQCGFKLVRNEEVFRSKVLPLLSVERFAWDVELILFMEKFRLRVREVPIRWQHKESSRVRIVHDSLEMLFAIRQMRRRLKKA